MPNRSGGDEPANARAVCLVPTPFRMKVEGSCQRSAVGEELPSTNTHPCSWCLFPPNRFAVEHRKEPTMFSRRLVLAAVVTLATTGISQADIITQLATANQPAAGGAPAVPNVTLMAGLGQAGVSFTNQYTSGGFP